MREKILSLLEKEDFVSGEYIAKNLGVTRTSVWKHIKSLEALGYKIQSVKNKGYKLISRPDKPIPEEITTNLDTKIIGRNIHYFEKVTSTNQIAKDFIKKNIKEGTIIVSDIQTKGRGRKNRKWFSPKGGLWFSVVLYPNIPPERGMLITMICSISVAQAIKEETGIECVIKWPNDLLIDGKKVCGILTEIDAEIDQINYAIVGIGININNKIPLYLGDIAVSLKRKKDTNIFRVKLLKSIIKNLDKNYQKMLDKKYEYVREKWFSYSNILGRKVQINQENTAIRGIVKDVDSSGCIILEKRGEIIRIVSGDLNFL